MIGSFGVLSTGVAIKRIGDIIGQIGDSLTGDLGDAFSLLSQTPEGQLVNRASEQMADLWEFGEQVYNAMYPDTASDTSLDLARSLTNNFRIPSTATVVNGVVLVGTPGAAVPSSFQLSVPGAPAILFQISEATTIGLGGTVTAAFVCTVDGPNPVVEETLTNIVTPTTGIDSAINPTDGETGTLAESDAAYRIRSAQELAKSGTGSFSGLLQAVQRVTNVSSAFLFSNDTNDVDADGLQPHSIHLIVVGGIDQEVADMVFAAKGAGIETNGSTALTVTDSQGQPHTVKFSRLTQLPIYVSVTITANANPSVGPVYPSNGDQLIQTAILALAASYTPGQNVNAITFITPINTIPGVLAATVYVGTAPGPTDPSVAVGVTQVAQFPPANVIVSH